MAYQTHLADTFRAAGLTVVEIPGWETRGDDDLDPRGIILHHTVTTKAADKLLAYGRADLAGPLANWSTQRDGTIHLVAAGTANHAGRFSVVSNPALRWSPRATQNRHTYGDEAINSGTGQPWPEAQIDSMVIAAAAVSRHHGWTAERTIGHKEWTTRKIDPAFINPRMTMDQIRNRISLVLHRDVERPDRPTITDIGDDLMADPHTRSALAYLAITEVYKNHRTSGSVPRGTPALGQSVSALDFQVNRYLESADPTKVIVDLAFELENE